MNENFLQSETIEPCFYGYGLLYDGQRAIEPLENSWTALTICKDNIEGFLLLEKSGYLVESVQCNNREKVKRNAQFKGNVARTKNGFFNLTGDTFSLDFPSNALDLTDFSNNTISPNSSRDVGEKEQKDETDRAPGARNKLHTSQLQLDTKTSTSKTMLMRGTKPNASTKILAQTAPTALLTTTSAEYNNWLMEQDDEELGYFYDSAWKTVITKTRKPDPLKNPNRHLEMVIAIDDSVIKFHGRLRVKQYVLTLMNIVNAIYQDPSLEANMQIVIKELYFYEKKRHFIKLGDAKKSLENVNLWNKQLHQDYDDDDEDEPHDIALWLTRMDLGGPSGYAPVAGVCDPERSCALTRDEGLTCAFIIAHELAHILGLSHDGDGKNNNVCKDEALQGSVMAPMVSATFHHFLWSECSRKEFRTKVTQWQCLLDEPDKKKSIGLNSTLETKFTMDEQCRVEFGEGYMLCRSFDIVEPCAHLWCGHVKSPFVCKTKKGPPLEGTECGPQKWCLDGYCDSTLRINLDPLKYNPQDGGWSDWGPWAACSRTCDLGMQFRARTCDNPKPAYGGRDCAGLPEEWRVCHPHECPEPFQDYRAQQCHRMPRLLDVPKNFTWLPYESDQMDLKCKFICQSAETGEIYASDENLVDGTFCSYDYDNRRCVQGQCVDVGCDHQVNSTIIEDGCGVCGGNKSQCATIKATMTKRIKKQITRLGVLHNQARHIAIELEIIQENQDNPQMRATTMNQIDLFLKDRKRNTYRIRKSLQPARNGNYSRWELHQDEKDHKDHMKQQHNAFLNDVRDDRQQHTNEYDHNGITRTIIQGAMFRYHGYGQVAAKHHQHQDNGNQTQQTLFLSAKGPILSELILFVEVKNLKKDALKIKVDMEYLINNKHKESLYEWITGGWGSCSKSCGGGKMFKTKGCVEKHSQQLVARKFCSIVTKPPTEIQMCNNFSCNFVWIPGEWEACSTTCGKHGVQTREIYCVPQNIVQNRTESDIAPWTFMLPPTKCGYQPPATSRPCARTYCPGRWEFTHWSTCSSSCEYGVQMREAVCQGGESTILAGDDYISCGSDLGPKQHQLCTNPIANCHSHGICLGDTSPLCSVGSLKRYCRIETFRELCCQSCNLQRLTPIVI